MAVERIVPERYGQPGHLQTPWWTGFNDARNRRDYQNSYTTITAKYEYQQGYALGRE